MKSRRVSTAWKSSWRVSGSLPVLLFLALAGAARAQEGVPAGAQFARRADEVYQAASRKTVLLRGRMEADPDSTTTGTAAVLTSSGLLVTCAHVVEGATDLEALFANGRRFRATIVGTHPRADLALLSIRGKDLEAFDVRPDPPRAGEWVLALGYPGGAALDLSPAPALGRVAQTGHDLAETVTGRLYNGMIRSDVPIFQGNSGGPLVDLAGNLVGINAAISVFDGQAYAIPIGRVLDELAELRAGKTIERDPPRGRPVPARPAPEHVRRSIDGLFQAAAAKERPWVVRLLAGSSHLGYGVVLDPAGLVAAPQFLVEPYRRVDVRLEDGRTLEGAVGATDHRYGVTLVKVDALGLAVPEIAPPESIRVGRTVLAVGTNRRLLGVGLLGSAGREIQKEKTRRLLEGLEGFDLGTLSPPADFAEVLQHDTPLALADLGSPIVDLQDRLVGINLANNVRGATYAPPASAIRASIAELAAGRDVFPPPRPFLGVDLRELSPEEIEARKIEGGLLVEEILPGFTAARAGLEKGDVLVMIGGVRIRVVEQLAEVLSRLRPGSKTVVRLVRDGSERDLPIVLDKMP